MFTTDEYELRITQLETELSETKRMMQIILDHIPVRVFWKDKELRYVACNRLFAQDARLESPGEIVGKDDYELSWAEVADLYRADDSAVIESGEARINYEEPQTREDGTKSWLRTTKTPLWDETGNIIGVLGLYEDITEHKLAEQRMHQQQLFMRQVMDSTPVLIGVKDWDGRFQFVNRTLADMYGTTSEDMIGKTDANFNPNQSEVAQYLEADRKVMRSNQQLLIPEEQITSASGETRWLQTIKIPLQDESGNPQVLLVASDISTRKQAEIERDQLQRQVIEAQRQALLELSSPIIPIMDRIIVMPLVGGIDTTRSRDIMRSLLEGISQYRAQIAILDITGVPVVDSGVADHLNRTMQAARLKGAQTIITGVSDAVAETIVDLGIDWSGFETLRDLQTGLVTALQRVGFQLTQRATSPKNGG